MWLALAVLEPFISNAVMVAALVPRPMARNCDKSTTFTGVTLPSNGDASLSIPSSSAPKSCHRDLPPLPPGRADPDAARSGRLRDVVLRRRMCAGSGDAGDALSGTSESAPWRRPDAPAAPSFAPTDPALRIEGTDKAWCSRLAAEHGTARITGEACARCRAGGGVRHTTPRNKARNRARSRARTWAGAVGSCP